MKNDTPIMANEREGPSHVQAKAPHLVDNVKRE
jgi:hypothetical protein